MSQQSIPVVDLDRFVRGDASQQAGFVQQLGQALSEYGFVAVDHPGLDASALAGTQAALKRLFDLPASTKRAFDAPDGGRQRGYSSFGREPDPDGTAPDRKEFWHIGPELDESDPLRDRIPRNVWPMQVPEFRIQSLALFQSLLACGHHLLAAIARFLDADEAAFMAMIEGGNTILRLIRYPAPGEGEVSDGGVWAAPHEDINLITLLPEPSETGLQILCRDGSWLDVAPVSGQLIADAGDMLQRLTNGLIPSTTHRVLQPSRARGPRYAMPFFVHPQPDYVLAPLPRCLTEDNPRRWEDITAEGYLLERVREIGLTTAQGHAGRYQR